MKNNIYIYTYDEQEQLKDNIFSYSQIAKKSALKALNADINEMQEALELFVISAIRIMNMQRYLKDNEKKINSICLEITTEAMETALKANDRLYKMIGDNETSVKVDDVFDIWFSHFS